MIDIEQEAWKVICCFKGKSKMILSSNFSKSREEMNF